MTERTEAMSVFKTSVDHTQGTILVSRKEWDALRKDVAEIREQLAVLADAMQDFGNAAAGLADSPLGKMLANMFPRQG